jgi:hypothetical protein
MKFSGYPIFFCILTTILLPVPVSADEIYPTITDVFFEKDGLPCNESVQFTVNCYGYACKSWDCKRDAGDLLARNGNFSPELVFSYHATCPSYGCRIYEPYFHAERILGTSCNLEGTAPQGAFFILNFSRSPLPQNCTDLHQYDAGKGNGRYYTMTPEYYQCVNETRQSSLRCNQYLAPCEPGKDYDCGYRVVDGHYVKETSPYRACRDTIDREKRECDQSMKRIDPATLILWKDGDQELPARRACELRFTIPSENSSESVHVPPMQVDHIGMEKDSGSFWCWIVRVFGGRC